MAEKYQKCYARQKKRSEVQATQKNMTPNTKVYHFLQGRTVDSDVRTELFKGEVLKNQILKKSLGGKTVKKYRMQSALRFQIRNAVSHKVNKVKQKIREKVYKFFHDDENTTLSPGKKDVITRNKIRKQKRYLNTTMKELHERFAQQNPDIRISVTYCRVSDIAPVKAVYFCKLSECTHQNLPAIWASLEPILEDVLHDDRVRVLYFMSDSPQNQYRNKKNFHLLGEYLKVRFPSVRSVIWNFTEADHRKGALDGVGGYLKRTADNIISSGHDVNNINILHDILKEHYPNIKLWIIGVDSVLKVDSFLSTAAELKTVKRTMNVHQVTAALGHPKTKMNYRTLSCEECELSKNCEHNGIFSSGTSHLPKSK
ncbi:hypothetical protein PR048_008467 [Dryococelus australis]|uniref:Uncharacterized protein n=1 Tax=Dryococelus australis TaxID=614101 RepID=A0ABQ9HX75_9NEOP|nr:hypothetical protein PR048_008467 [Dryococelus australis]